MITILGILSICLSMGLVYLGIKARTTGLPIFDSQYIVNGKFFGEPADLRFFVNTDYAIQKEAENLKGDTDLATISKTYNSIEENYHYVEDD